MKFEWKGIWSEIKHWESSILRCSSVRIFWNHSSKWHWSWIEWIKSKVHWTNLKIERVKTINQRREEGFSHDKRGIVRSHFLNSKLCPWNSLKKVTISSCLINYEHSLRLNSKMIEDEVIEIKGVRKGRWFIWKWRRIKAKLWLVHWLRIWFQSRNQKSDHVKLKNNVKQSWMEWRRRHVKVWTKSCFKIDVSH